jgi:hypothetical protein
MQDILVEKMNGASGENIAIIMCGCVGRRVRSTLLQLRDTFQVHSRHGDDVQSWQHRVGWEDEQKRSG